MAASEVFLAAEEVAAKEATKKPACLFSDDNAASDSSMDYVTGYEGSNGKHVHELVRRKWRGAVELR